MVDTTTRPICTAEELLFLQDHWVTADVPELYTHLRPMVTFEIEPQEGLLVMEFRLEDRDKMTDTLTRFGCKWIPLEGD
jgi:hypothetical protein